MNLERGEGMRGWVGGGGREREGRGGRDRPTISDPQSDPRGNYTESEAGRGGRGGGGHMLLREPSNRMWYTLRALRARCLPERTEESPISSVGH